MLIDLIGQLKVALGINWNGFTLICLCIGHWGLLCPIQLIKEFRFEVQVLCVIVFLSQKSEAPKRTHRNTQCFLKPMLGFHCDFHCHFNRPNQVSWPKPKSMSLEVNCTCSGNWGCRGPGWGGGCEYQLNNHLTSRAYFSSLQISPMSSCMQTHIYSFSKTTDRFIYYSGSRLYDKNLNICVLSRCRYS